jgi:hypothetical protein
VKVNPGVQSAAVAIEEQRPFREVLALAPASTVTPAPRAPAVPRPPAVPPLAAVQRAPAVPRPPPAEAPSEVQGPVAAGEAGAEDPEPRTRKLLELITQELTGAQEGGGTSAANDLPYFLPGAPPAADDPRQQHLERSAAAVALIEKIQVFVRHGQRPVLALTLNNALAARVEIERLGPGRVAVRMVGHRGPPSPEAVSRVRDELLARGLKVGAISVA